MKLSQAIASQVSSGSRTRGLAYISSGAVLEVREHASGVEAIVRGSDNYRVRVEIEHDLLRASCTCPYFLDRLEACKHIWALVLTCEARNIPLVAPGVSPEAVDFDPIYSDEDEDEDEQDVDDYVPWVPNIGFGAARFTGPTGAPSRLAKKAPWQQILETVGQAPPTPGVGGRPIPGQLLYVVDLSASQQAQTLVVHLMSQEQKKNGDWGVPKAARVGVQALGALADSDRAILERSAGARPAYAWAWGAATYEFPSPFHLRGILAVEQLPLICATGRCRLALTQIVSMRPQDAGMTSLAWDDDVPWKCRVDVRRDETEGTYVITGALQRGSALLSLADAVLLLDEGLVLTRTHAARLDHGGALPWMRELGRHEPVAIPFDQRDVLRDAILASQPPTADLPEELRVEPLIVVKPADSQRLKCLCKRQGSKGQKTG